MAVLQPLPSFGIQYSPAPRKTGRRSPIAVSVEKAFDYSANGARVPLRVKLENTTGSDRKATLQFHEGWNGNRRTSHTYPFFIPARESVHAVVYPPLSYNLVYEVKENHEGASPIPTDTEHTGKWSRLSRKALRRTGSCFPNLPITRPFPPAT